jgi:hypothetical protein
MRVNYVLPSFVSFAFAAREILRSPRWVVKNAALQYKGLNLGDVWVTDRRLSTVLCTGNGDMQEQGKNVAHSAGHVSDRYPVNGHSFVAQKRKRKAPVNKRARESWV